MFAAAKGLLGDVAAGIETFFFPSLCRGCAGEMPGLGPRFLCGGCRAALAAPLCDDWRGASLIGDGAAPRFARAPYDGPAGAAARMLKFEGRREMAALLAGALAPLAAKLASRYELDVLVPVPLHPRRRRERRFNQAEELGGKVAAEVGVAFLAGGLSRVRDTTPQVELSGHERLKNVHGAFAARETFDGRRVLVIDDVITTGATVIECARVLRDAGAATVVCVAAAAGAVDGAMGMARR